MQRDIVRIAMSLPQAENIALAGGGAMLAHGFIDRVTHDLDLFTPDAADVQPVTDALTAALRDHGYHVDVVRQHDTFAQLAVTNTAGSRTDVDIAQDAFRHEPVKLGVGRVIAADEVAANKTLALFGRAEARDLLDVDALTRHYGHEQLLELAARADSGFDRTYFADALDRAAAWPDSRFTELGVSPAQLHDIRERAGQWAHQLRQPESPRPVGSDHPNSANPNQGPTHPDKT